MEKIKKYFPSLSGEQMELFEKLAFELREWNEKINVVSRKDIEQLEERHILHSLAIAKAQPFEPGAQILDLGTGGGLPGLPLAILFPEAEFWLVDSIGKKIKVVEEVARSLGLKNVQAFCSRAESLPRNVSFDFVVTRGVAPLADLMRWSQRLLKRKHRHALPNGLLALKGGDLRAELAALPGGAKKAEQVAERFRIQDFFPEPVFEDKWVVYVQG